MKTLILIFLADIILNVTCSIPKDHFTITGKISGLADETVLELVPGATRQKENPVAEAVIKDGKFSFTAQAKEPRLFYIKIKEKKSSWIRVIAENGLSVSVKVDSIGVDPGEPDFIYFYREEITGSPYNDLYEQKMAFRRKLDKAHHEMREKHSGMNELLRKARIDGNKQLWDSLQLKTEAGILMNQDEKEWSREFNAALKKAITDDKDSWWGPFLMLSNLNWFTEEHKELYAVLSPEAQNSFYGQVVKKEMFPAASKGNVAPGFTVKDSQGKSLTLEALCRSKKYVLIDFWASWCGPCRKEIPHLKEIYKRFAAKEFEIISISLDKDAEAWQKALNTEQMPWPNFLDDAGVADAYSIKSIPAMFLVDKNGMILETGLRGEALDKKLAELMP